MTFIGISRVFSTLGNRQFETIGAFWEEWAGRYGRDSLQGLGYHWTEDSIEYAIGRKEGEIEHANCSVELPDEGWMTVRGRTEDLDKLYDQIYLDGALRYEIETFSDDGECEIRYYR